MQIILLRHGATDWNLQSRCQGSSDRELNEVGVRQAEQIAAHLSSEIIDAIYSSNLQRARHTAHLVSLPHQLPVLVEDEIRELDHGELEGLTFNEIKEKHGEFLKLWRIQPAEIQIPGGESLAHVTERAWTALNRIVARHPDEANIVVVSHNFPILGIVCRITGTHLNHYRNFHLDPCGVTRLSVHNGQWTVTHVNSRRYTSTSVATARPIP